MTQPGAANYDSDFYAWAMEQAALIRAGNLAAVDLEHVAEEIESMGKSEKRELINRLNVLLLHLLKWRFQPGFRSRSWRLSVEEQRYRLEGHLRDNPSLKAKLPEAIADAYHIALVEAERETGLPRNTFPTVCPWSLELLIDDDFWPEG